MKTHMAACSCVHRCTQAQTYPNVWVGVLAYAGRDGCNLHVYTCTCSISQNMHGYVYTLTPLYIATCELGAVRLWYAYLRGPWVCTEWFLFLVFNPHFICLCSLWGLAVRSHHVFCFCVPQRTWLLDKHSFILTIHLEASRNGLRW